MKRVSSIGLLENFLVLAEELNFRRAAMRLNLDQSALTRRIQKLEDALDTQLFIRTTHEVRLTEAGRYFYEMHSETVARYERSLDEVLDVARGVAGRLKVGYMSFAAIELMPQALASFQKAYPLVSIALRYAPTHKQKILLARNEIDLGFLIGPVHHPDLSTRCLAREPLCLLMRRESLPGHMAGVSASDLRDLDLVMGDNEDWNAYRWHLEHLFALDGIAPRISCQVSDAVSLLGLVRAGLGSTILPRSMAAIAPPEIAVLPISTPHYQIETVLAWHSAFATTNVKQFVRSITMSDKTQAGADR